MSPCQIPSQYLNSISFSGPSCFSNSATNCSELAGPVVLKIVNALVFHHQKGCSHQSKNHWKILHHFSSQLYCNISHPPVVDTFSYDFFKTWNTATSMGYSAWVELGEWCRFLYKTSLTAERGVKCVHQKRATRFFFKFSFNKKPLNEFACLAHHPPIIRLANYPRFGIFFKNIHWDQLIRKKSQHWHSFSISWSHKGRS